MALKLEPCDSLFLLETFSSRLLSVVMSHTQVITQDFFYSLNVGAICRNSPRTLPWVPVSDKIIMQPGRTTQWTRLVLLRTCYVLISQPPGPIQFSIELILEFFGFKN